MVVAAVVLPSASFAQDPLPGWRDGANKTAIVDFVTAVTTPGKPGFVAERNRLAVFRQ
jgi:hypothetical protein